LTDPLFAPTWAEIDKLGLPVLVHPTNPQGADALHMNELGLVPPIGFMVDTTVAISRMILAGFIDRHPNLKLIAAHGGAALPYLAGRLDRCHEMIPACAEFIKDKPSTYLQRIWYDSVVYDQRALELCISVAGSPDRVLYGSDYPHNIGDMAGCLARVNALPGDQAKRVAGKAAEKIFRL
jgi:aminocarboxymuconate-semialdehyde decarboxylase